MKAIQTQLFAALTVAASLVSTVANGQSYPGYDPRDNAPVYEPVQGFPPGSADPYYQPSPDPGWNLRRPPRLQPRPLPSPELAESEQMPPAADEAPRRKKKRHRFERRFIRPFLHEVAPTFYSRGGKILRRGVERGFDWADRQVEPRRR